MDFPKHCPHRGIQPDHAQTADNAASVHDLASARLNRLLTQVGKAVAGYQGKPCCVPLSLYPMRQALAEQDAEALADLVTDAVWQLNQCAEQCPALPPLFELMRCCQHSDPAYRLRFTPPLRDGENPAPVAPMVAKVPSRLG